MELIISILIFIGVINTPDEYYEGLSKEHETQIQEIQDDEHVLNQIIGLDDYEY